MTNKLNVIINSLKVPKITKILLYEMKFPVPNYSCLQSPWLEGYSPQIPVLSVLCPQLNFVEHPSPRTKFLGTPLGSSGKLLWSRRWNFVCKVSWKFLDYLQPLPSQDIRSMQLYSLFICEAYIVEAYVTVCYVNMYVGAYYICMYICACMYIRTCVCTVYSWI